MKDGEAVNMLYNVDDKWTTNLNAKGYCISSFSRTCFFLLLRIVIPNSSVIGCHNIIDENR